MRTIGATLMMMLLAGAPVGAQQRDTSDTSYTISAPNEVKKGVIQQGDVRDCRVRKRGGDPECRSRDGWRDVRRELDRLKPPADFEEPR